LPTDARFNEIATLYYQELTRLFGKSDYYSMDPFHESNDDASIDYAAAGRAMMQAMKHVNPKAVWVIQGWTENPRPQMVDTMDPKDLLVLDLFSECRPMFGIPSIWQRKEGYKQHPWLFCMLENFGANVGLHGRMDQLLSNFYQARTRTLNGRPSTLSGIGFTMEGSENNPVMFELMSELPWRSEKVTKEQWIKEYVKARYGTCDEQVMEAWNILINTIYNCPVGNNQQGPHESIFCGRPTLNNFQASSWSKMRNYYDPEDTRRAALLMNSAAEIFRGNNNFEYDLVDIMRQALADQARIQYQRTIAAYKSFSRKQFDKEAKTFMQMLKWQDELLGTRTEFRLGHWTEAARKCGTNQAESDQYEWNARVQITTWGNRTCADKGGLRDYAHKEWQGLLKDFYAKRWEAYFKALAEQMEKATQPQPDMLGTGKNSNKTADELFAMALPQEVKLDWYAMEEPWTLQHNAYAAAPEGNPVDVAKKIAAFMENK
jgi:alpha-N-acetylglucosaminidase